MFSRLKNKFNTVNDSWLSPKNGFLPDDNREVQVIVSNEGKNSLLTSSFDPEIGWLVQAGRVIVWKEIDPTIKKLIG